MPDGGVTLNSAYLRPRSRGTVRLASSDPLAAPLIDPNYWADSFDREMSIRGLKLAREIMRQDALKPFVKAERLPGPDVQTEKDYFEYACRHSKTDQDGQGHTLGILRTGRFLVSAANTLSSRSRKHRPSSLNVIEATATQVTARAWAFEGGAFVPGPMQASLDRA